MYVCTYVAVHVIVVNKYIAITHIFISHKQLNEPKKIYSNINQCNQCSHNCNIVTCVTTSLSV